MTQTTNDVIDMIRRIIADDTADLRERLQHLEHRSRGEDNGSPSPSTDFPDSDVSGSDHHLAELQQRLDQIKALHKLDATPVQWTRDGTGKMVEAPEGLWEISCTACNHKTYYREGKDGQPQQCPTWRLADLPTS